MDRLVTLRRQTEIASLFSKGRRRRGTLLSVVATRTDLAGSRALFVTSRKVGNAVVRNRVRRRLREIWRGLGGQLPGGTDLAFVALPASASAAYRDLRDELSTLILRLGVLNEG